MTLEQQCDEATELAREAIAAGDLVTGIAAIQLAAQLCQLARLWGTWPKPSGAQRAKDKTE